MNKQNIYEHLDTDDSDDIHLSTQNEKRKASKKLREIELLEKKETLTVEEIEKVKMKQKWIKILHPIHDIKITNDECKMKQQARHIAKEKKREREKEKQKKDAERKQQESERREKIREEEKNQNVGCLLEKEFIDELTKNGGNVNRVFRLLSLKYHPDRNINQLKDSIGKQKILGNIREKYLEYLEQ